MIAQLVMTRAAAGQERGWNDPRTRALVELATKRRAEQLADTGLVDYHALAHGYVTFLAQMGDGFLEIPKLVKTDQLALEVYWHAPNQSKQRIIGRRDTLMLPTDIQYHSDHLGIIQNNFPDFIRIGDGDEVRDVPHPLSPAGLKLYDFQIGDSVRIRAGADPIDLIEVKVKPKEDRDARVVGAIYLDPAGGQVVRMAFNFTHASFLDPALEDLAVVLENRLIAGRFWLPGRQQIEIRRTGTWLDYPVRGIIRGWWDVGDYDFNIALPAQTFVGPEIVSAAPAQLKAYQWPGAIMDSLPPDVRATVDPDIRRVQDEARMLVRARALERIDPVRFSARRVSDIVRVNRVEGLSIGSGVSTRLSSRLFFTARARLGMDDHHQLKGLASLRWEQPSGTQLELFGGRDLANIGDEEERSSVINSLAAQEFGSDYSDPFSRELLGARITRRMKGIDMSLLAGREQDKQVEVHGTPSMGSFEAAPQITPLRGWRLTIAGDRPMSPAPWGGSVRARFAASGLQTVNTEFDSGLLGAGTTSVRLSGAIEQRAEFHSNAVVFNLSGAVVMADTAPLQELAYFGGPRSLPGYDLHEVSGTRGLSGRLEWQLPFPFPSVPLGRFGRVPAQAHLAPYVAAAVVGGSTGCVETRGRCPALTSGVYPSAGVALLTLFDMLRLDVSRGFHNGRWTFNVDITRDFWSIM